MTGRLFTVDNSCKLRLSSPSLPTTRASVNIYKLAGLTPFGREVVVRRVRTARVSAERLPVSLFVVPGEWRAAKGQGLAGAQAS